MPASRQNLAVWVLCLGLATLAMFVRPHLGASPWIPGASVLALLFGALLVHVPAWRETLASASKPVVKRWIPFAIVLIGFGLNLHDFWGADVIGWGLFAVVAAMLVAFLAAGWIGKWFGLDARTSILLGAGTAVCGNSAIMAVAPVVDPEEDELAVSLGVINLLGLLMIFVLPPIASWVGIGGAEGGMLAGMTVHAVPQAIAAGETFGTEALEMATLYKLVRVGLLMPVVLLVALVWSRRGRGGAAGTGAAKVPGFLWLFVLAVALRSTGWLDGALSVPGLGEQPLWGHLQKVGKFLLTAVMAAVGMGIFLPTLLRVGPRILWVGIASAAAMTAVACAFLRTVLAASSSGL